MAEACRKTGKDLWIVLQVNSFDPEKWITENQLRFQAYSAMAFGARTILWACYTAGWWHNHVLDKDGEKTSQYQRLQRVNREIRTLAEDYMRYRWEDTHFAEQPVDAGVFLDVRAEDGRFLVVGQLESRGHDGSSALMLCPADDPYDTGSSRSRVFFRINGERKVTALSGKGEKPLESLPDGTFSVEIASNEGLLIQVLPA